MKTWELMRESLSTTDGRIVAGGGATWPEEGIPLMGASDGGLMQQHGVVSNIRREGILIFGDANIDLPTGSCLTVGGDVGDEVIETEDGKWLAMKFEMKYATVTDQEDYPWEG